MELRILEEDKAAKIPKVLYQNYTQRAPEPEVFFSSLKLGTD